MSIAPAGLPAGAGPDTAWEERQPPEPVDPVALAREFATVPPLSDFGCSPLFAQLLANRGILRPAQVEEFLSASLDDLHDPFLMRDMDRAATLVVEALRASVPVGVQFDYDTDGVQGGAIAVRMLRRTAEALGCEVPVHYYVPDRATEGYGVSLAGVERLAALGCGLLVTVDVGISAEEALGRARTLGMLTVVCDHHEPPPALPPADAICNPKRPDCPYPDAGLCGAGVAFKLAQAVYTRVGLGREALAELLPSAAVGSVADMMELVGETRTLVRLGLEEANRKPPRWLEALRRAAGLAGPLTAYDIGYRIGPRFNAEGRLAAVEVGPKLVLGDGTDAEVAAWAEHLDGANRHRQQELERALALAERLLEGQPERWRMHALVVAHAELHPGVVGLVASRLVERYHRPAAAIALDGSAGRGSARSIEALHLYEALQQGAHLLEQFGGHAKAAGFTIRADRVDALRDHLAELVSRLPPNALVRRRRVDARIRRPRAVNEALVRECDWLEPTGLGNPRPSFWLTAQVRSARRVGRDTRHLKLELAALDAGGRPPEPFPAIAFGGGEAYPDLARGDRVDVIARPQISDYNGRLELVVDDLQPASSF